MKLNDELLEKAKNTKSAEDLITLAKENGIELTAEEAKTCFAQLNSKNGALADDELDNVAGGRKCGTIYKDGRPVVTTLNSCEYFQKERTLERIPGGYCKDCTYSQVEGKDFPILVCRHPYRYEN